MGEVDVSRYRRILIRIKEVYRTHGLKALVAKISGRLFQKGSSILLLLLHSPWAVPAVYLMRWLKPWVLVRVGTFNSGRIGHFAGDVGHHYAALNEQPANCVDLYWLLKKTANDFWATMVSRSFPVSEWVCHLDRWNRIIPGGEEHCRLSSETGTRDIHGVLERHPNSMPFTLKEDQLAKDWLRGLGWKEGGRFVCLLVRDDEYLANDPLHGDGSDSSYSAWQCHAYRNSDIATYVPAIEWLADQGVWVFRMGKKMATPMPSSHDRVIDYAFREDKSDFMDVWLFAHCDLCISTGSGPDMISDVYRRPLLVVNYLQLRNLWSWSNAVHAPKHLMWGDSGRKLTWKEHLNHSYYRTNDYSEEGIDVKDLSPEELLEITKECWMRLDGKWKDEQVDTECQKKFWEILEAYPDFAQFHGWIHPESRVSSFFLRSNTDFLTE
ncbi:TIGR04372 family glycosyltransferase [Chlorobium phaeovibrioides]|uniref:TIGR04372 family glycosyltransferase n=1 Tax=Chlorobium phaeovibrioides TaxID=1094 RepID=A0A432AT10_CHLPH|nr:TIGR04372 family glycosyltransferase [Chlorobium phaeovibrioides]RTY35184.1 TIGR04372 family glycosyltransferase [Chlorobium phaeovibrioides]